MRFVSKITQIDYVVRPSQHQFSAMGTRMPNTPSVVAKFRNHTFDSVDAAKKEHWSPEIREAVEQHLLSHGDMGGRGLYVEGNAPEALTLTPDQLQRGLSCVATITSPDGSTMMCGKRPVIRDDMCAEHVAQFLPAQPAEQQPLPVSEPEPEPQVFACEDCGKSFDKAQGLRMHRMKVHPPVKEAV